MLKLEQYFIKETWKQYYNQAKYNLRRTKNVVEYIYWDLYYTIGYSNMSGIGNGLANLEEGKSFSEGFGQAYVNNFELGLIANLVYPIAFKKFEKSKHYRLYANLFTLGINLGFLVWHYFTGTENPLQTMAPSAAIGMFMANRHVSETKKNLEKRLL